VCVRVCVCVGGEWGWVGNTEWGDVVTAGSAAGGGTALRQDDCKPNTNHRMHMQASRSQNGSA
jgi:hypothetical protein